MLGRLIVGILKGLVLGSLLGYGLIQLGMGFPNPIVAYVAAAVTGVLIGLIAGKPIWAKDAKIEAGMKAGVGALLGLGLMYAVRRFLTTDVPSGLLNVTHVTVAEGTPAPIGHFAMTSLAVIAGALGGFYDADNTPEPEKEGESKEKKAAAPGKARIAEQASDEEMDEDLADESDKKSAKK